MATSTQTSLRSLRAALIRDIVTNPLRWERTAFVPHAQLTMCGGTHLS